MAVSVTAAWNGSVRLLMSSHASATGSLERRDGSGMLATAGREASVKAECIEAECNCQRPHLRQRSEYLGMLVATRHEACMKQN